jgi:hypothetical protein
MTLDVNTPPYRVEWRPDLVTRWLLIDHAGTRDEADDLAEKALKDHKGYVRLITQHVISASERPGQWERAA